MVLSGIQDAPYSPQSVGWGIKLVNPPCDPRADTEGQSVTLSIRPFYLSDQAAFLRPVERAERATSPSLSMK